MSILLVLKTFILSLRLNIPIYFSNSLKYFSPFTAITTYSSPTYTSSLVLLVLSNIISIPFFYNHNTVIYIPSHPPFFYTHYILLLPNSSISTPPYTHRTSNNKFWSCFYDK